jgi:hypothetical protein
MAKLEIQPDGNEMDTSPIVMAVRKTAVLNGPDCDFENALKWADKHGTRLFTRAEAQYLYEHDPQFREAVKSCVFWVLETQTTESSSEDCAWVFSGSDGFIYVTYKVHQTIFKGNRWVNHATRCLNDHSEPFSTLGTK